jgi:phosphoglycolate phosphatase
MEQRRPAPALAAIVFDFDGTLAELNIDFAALQAEVRALARRQGYTGPWPSGYLLEEVAALATELGEDFSLQAQGLIQRRELEAAARGRLFPFTRVLLEQVRTAGYRLGVITRNCGAAVRRVFPEVEQTAQCFLPRERVVRVKPHPEHLLAACRRLEVPPAQTAMVGDHPTDMEAARAAGCLAVGVASGRVSAPELRAAGAQVVLPDASGLLEHLARGED